jgi:hypothetical protein
MWFSGQSIRLEKLLQLLTKDLIARIDAAIPPLVGKRLPAVRNQK